MDKKKAMDKYEHKILLIQILRNKKVPMPITISLGTFVAPLKYDRMGQPISEELWEILSNEIDYFKMAHDQVDDFEIYTCWIGIDRSGYADEDEKFIFQTIMLQNGEPLDYTFYYSDDEKAMKNHQKLSFIADQKFLENYLENL